MEDQDRKFSMTAFFVVLSVIFLMYFFVNRSNNEELKNYKTTNGIVTNFSYSNYSYFLEYEYTVADKKYKGHISNMTSFYCEDSTFGCIGRIFKVKYAKDNPKISEMDLLGYNRFKPYKP